MIDLIKMESYYISLYCTITKKYIASYYTRIPPNKGDFIILEYISENNKGVKFEVKERVLTPHSNNSCIYNVKGYLITMKDDEIN